MTMTTTAILRTSMLSTKTMRAARLCGPSEVRALDDVRVPRPASAEVLVDVVACGVTPTLHSVVTGAHRVVTGPLPAILGSGAVGVVSALGPEARDVRIGDRVFVDPVLTCGTCAACLRGNRLVCASRALMGAFGYREEARALLGRYQGGFAERVLAPAASCVPLPTSVPFVEAPRLGYLATALEAIRTAKVEPTDEVVVLGATGALGAACVLFALAAGARRVFAVSGSARRLLDLAAYDARIVALAREGSTTKTMLVSAAPRGCDVVLDAQGLFSKAHDLEAAIAHLRGGGRAVLLGGVTEPVKIDYLDILRRGLRITGSWMASRSTIARMFDAPVRGLLPRATIQRYPLARALDAIRAAASRGTRLPLEGAVVVEP